MKLHASHFYSSFIKVFLLVALVLLAPTLFLHVSSAQTTPAFGSWSQTGSLQKAQRTYFGLTLLKDGRALLAGGTQHNGVYYDPNTDPPIPEAEIYDPTIGQWAETGRLNTPRFTPGQLLTLNNGKVLISGGSNFFNTFASAELYDPATGQWSYTGSMNSPRALPSANLLKDGRVLVAGGNNGNGSILSTAEIYDPATSQWTYTGSMNYARQHHMTTALKDGRVMVAGGAPDSASATAEIYNPTNGQWTAITMPWTWTYGSIVTLADGRVLVAGGGYQNQSVSNAAIYDPTNGTWKTTASMPYTFIPQTLLLNDGRVLAFGTPNNVNLVTAVYDPITEQWSSFLDNNLPSGGALLKLVDGRILSAGGFELHPGVGVGYAATAISEIFTPSAPPPPPLTNQWNLAADFRGSPNQANPNPDNFGNSNVWYFMQSSTVAHDPTTYALLPEFVTDSFFIPRIPGWQGTQVSTSVKDKLSSVRKNTTGTFQQVGTIAWPSGVVGIHPILNQMVVVGWHSPINGTITIAGSFTDIDNVCGNGINWFIDKGSTTLAQGLVTNGGSQIFQNGTNGATLSTVSVNQGDFIYFIVDSKEADWGCDTTGLDVTISTTTSPPPPTNRPPTANAGGPYSVVQGGSVTLNGSGNDLDAGDILTYSWDKDNDGTFETPGQSITFSAVGLLPGSKTVKLQVCDNHGACATSETTVNILSNLAITTNSPLPSGTVGTTYFVTFAATGGTLPYTWDINQVDLPPGLTLNTTTGELSGTPTSAGTFSFSVKVTDSSLVVVTKQFNFAPPPPPGDAGSGYTVPVVITPPSNGGGGGPPPTCSNYVIVGGGQLPPGLSLDPTTGIITGTPLDGGTYNFTVQCTVNGGGGGQIATKDFTITINNPAPVLTNLDPNSAQAGGVGFTMTLNGSGYVQSSKVLLNGTERTSTYVSATKLTLALSATDLANPAVINVKVKNPGPGGGESNAKDFTIISPMTPISGVGSATPGLAALGGTVTLKVTVTPGQFPTSSGVVVKADLSSIGGSANQSFSGVGNDFTFVYIVPNSVTAGNKNLAATISDAQGRTASATISLTLQTPVEKCLPPTTAQISQYQVVNSSSGKADTAYPLSNLVDQFNYTFWRWINYPKAVAVEVNLGSLQTLDAIKLFVQNPTKAPNTYFQYKDSAGGWSDIPGLSSKDAGAAYGWASYPVPNLTAQYWRIVVDNTTYLSDIANFGDLQLCNLSLGGTGQAISPASPAQPTVSHRLNVVGATGSGGKAANLLDGLSSTEWVVTGKPATASLELDLGQTRTVTALKYFSTSSAVSTDTAVQYWNGTAWATIPGLEHVNTGNNGPYDLQAVPNFGPVQASKIRFVINNVAAQAWSVGGYGDIQIFGY